MNSFTRPSSRFGLLRLLFTAFAIAAAALLASEVRAAEQLYTCGMHPQIIKKAPGDCPICGMKLTPVRANAAGKGTAASSGERKLKYYKSTLIPGEVRPEPGKDSMGMDMVPVYENEDSSASVIQIHPATVQRMNVKTDLVARGPVNRLIRAVGTVEFNERGLRDITTKYEGWIEKLHVNATWTSVKAGDPLFEIYSPDLYSAQLNYLVALRAEGAEGGSFTRASRERLELFDVSPEFVAEITKSGKARRTYLYRAPSDGVVIDKMGIEGQMMKPGERVYRLADLSSVWVHAQIYEKDLAAITPGQDAEVRASYGSDKVYHGTVAQLLPQVESVTRAATARLVIDNKDGFLRPGMFTEVRFKTTLAEDAVLVPDSAVLRSGERNTVFVALDAGSFEPREVKLGARTDDHRYAVLSGLSAGERVVISGQFMLDSESQLREAIQKMMTIASAGQPAPATDTPASGGPAPAAAPAAKPQVLPANAIALLTPLALASADAGAALAADDFAGYTKQLPALRAALAAFFNGYEHAAHGPLAPFMGGLADPTDLAAARRDFEPFSSAVADLARENHLQHTEKLYVYECTMAPETGKARWLQREHGAKNPFYGSDMLRCGDELAAPPAPSTPTSGTGGGGGGAPMTLPPGHPPIDSSTLASFARIQTAANAAAKRKPADSGCGSCGMSMAAMAAGEPCEQTKK